METTRRALSENEITTELNKLKRNGRTDKIIELVGSDYSFGLSKEEINIYLSKSLEIAQMYMVSRALRECNVELAQVIAQEKYDKNRMQVAIEFCNKGVPVEAIKKGLEQTVNAHGLKEVLKKVLLAVNIDTEKEMLKQQLEEKDEVIRSQQKTIEEVMLELSTLKKENRTLEESIKAEEQRSEATVEKPVVAPTPVVQYTMGVSNSEHSTTPIQVERTTPSKQTGMYALVGKLAFKKKSRQDIVGMVASGRLDTEQLVQIKHAIERGLTEQQLIHLINSCVPSEQMKEIIDIAELENKLM